MKNGSLSLFSLCTVVVVAQQTSIHLKRNEQDIASTDLIELLD